MRARVRAAKVIQKNVLNGTIHSDTVCNADMRVEEIRKFCKLLGEG